MSKLVELKKETKATAKRDYHHLGNFRLGEEYTFASCKNCNGVVSINLTTLVAELTVDGICWIGKDKADRKKRISDTLAEILESLE